jgi:hypothetical protein
MSTENPLWIARQIQRRMDVCKRKMATQAVAALSGLIGKFAAGEANVTGQVKAVQTKKADGTLDTSLLEEVDYACLNAGYASTPYLFGWGEAWQYFRRLEAGCCTLNGVDAGELAAKSPLVMIGDRRIPELYPDATSQGYFFTAELGAIQPLWWNEFEGPEGINTVDDAHYKQTVLVDPRSGIPFDFIWSNNCGKISIQVKLAWQLVGLPADLYPTGDRLEGVTFVNKYRIVNP